MSGGVGTQACLEALVDTLRTRLAHANLGLAANAHANLGLAANAHANLGLAANAPANLGLTANAPANLGPARVEEGALLVPAAVLVPLFVSADEPCVRVWLVRRTDTLRAHRGQVALPGGKCEPEDSDPCVTALREAEEEVGLEPRWVELLGALGPTVTSTGYRVWPFVGWVREPFSPVPRAGEVARAFSARLARFESPPDRELSADDPRGPVPPSVRVYVEDGEVVWGATAQILRSLARLARPSDLEARLLRGRRADQ